jgi:hypothetical protein
MQRQRAGQRRRCTTGGVDPTCQSAWLRQLELAGLLAAAAAIVFEHEGDPVAIVPPGVV